MDENISTNLNTQEEAENLLSLSRKRIDVIDRELIKLIAKRTSLSKDIVDAKIALNMEIYDKNREKLIFNKINNLAIENNLDSKIIIQIMEILTNLNKKEQEKILQKNKL